MTEQNKQTLIQFGKVLAFSLPAFMAIITFAGVLNGVVAHGLDAFYGWVAGLHLGAEVYPFYLYFRKLFPKKVDDKQNERS